ncbi:MAG: hypothetical protein ABI878_14135 [Acidobacteriota bacterium]
MSEIEAIGRLSGIREAFRAKIADDFEHRAKTCGTCETPGACCLDAHFVNVRISRLEAAAIRRVVDGLSDDRRTAVYSRIENAISDYGLVDPDNEKFACPLFEKGIGCLVHDTAKPLPCIAHACYENKNDLPPDKLLAFYEIKIDKLNKRVYGREMPVVSIPPAIMKRP